MGVEEARPGRAESMALGLIGSSCRLRVGIGLAWRSCLLTGYVPSSAQWDLKAVVWRRRWLTSGLPLHGLGKLLLYAP